MTAMAISGDTICWEAKEGASCGHRLARKWDVVGEGGGGWVENGDRRVWHVRRSNALSLAEIIEAKVGAVCSE